MISNEYEFNYFESISISSDCLSLDPLALGVWLQMGRNMAFLFFLYPVNYVCATISKEGVNQLQGVAFLACHANIFRYSLFCVLQIPLLVNICNIFWRLQGKDRLIYNMQV